MQFFAELVSLGATQAVLNHKVFVGLRQISLIPVTHSIEVALLLSNSIKKVVERLLRKLVWERMANHQSYTVYCGCNKTEWPSYLLGVFGKNIESSLTHFLIDWTLQVC